MKATLNRKQKDWIDGLRQSLIEKGELLADGRKPALRGKYYIQEPRTGLYISKVGCDVSLQKVHTFEHSGYRPPAALKRPYNGDARHKDGIGKPAIIGGNRGD